MKFRGVQQGSVAKARPEEIANKSLSVQKNLLRPTPMAVHGFSQVEALAYHVGTGSERRDALEIQMWLPTGPEHPRRYPSAVVCHD